MRHRAQRRDLGDFALPRASHLCGPRRCEPFAEQFDGSPIARRSEHVAPCRSEAWSDIGGYRRVELRDGTQPAQVRLREDEVGDPTCARDRHVLSICLSVEPFRLGNALVVRALQRCKRARGRIFEMPAIVEDGLQSK